MKRRLIDEIEDDNPLDFVSNLFDVALIISLAFLVMLVTAYDLTELLTPNEKITIVKNPGEENMQIIVKDGEVIKVMNLTAELQGGQGEKIGTAYRLKDGTIIYVPEKTSTD
ncbi:MAG: DUF2149 domain-containing protein [Archaeoglobales archaeon]|nr:DUF2149 domain-containing protein [Archaeoglobales archaeon]